MVNKVDTCLFISNTAICVVYVYGCIFCARLQSDIDNVIKYFKGDIPSYNWEHPKGESASEFLVIDTKKLDYCLFHFYLTGLVCKVLVSTGM